MNNINYFGLFREIRYILISAVLSIICVGSVIFIYNHTGIYGAIFFAIIIFLTARLLMLGAHFNPSNHDSKPFPSTPESRGFENNISQSALKTNKANNNSNQNKNQIPQDRNSSNNLSKSQGNNQNFQNGQRNNNLGSNNPTLDN
jgi:hypothetical protein